MIIRDATEGDIKEILDIYSYYIKHTAITFETEIPSMEVFCQRFHLISSVYPWFVAFSDNDLVGYSYACSHRERQAFRWSVDCAVYVHKDFIGQGIGTQLYQRLIPEIKDLGYYNAFALIALPNEKSVALHESFGFEMVGITKSAGYKLGMWHDVGYWQLKLRQYDSNPEEPAIYKSNRAASG